MKKLLLLIAVFCALKVNAQNYLITFAGTGASTTLTIVLVENLTAGGAILTLNGNDVLRLTITTGINPIDNGQSTEMKIYPNPTSGNSILQVSPPYAGKAIISVIDITGKLVFKIPFYLENYPQEFRLSGLKSGLYLISVKGSNFQYSGKLLSNSKESGTISIEKISNNQTVDKKKTKTDSKGELTTVDMNYTIGDWLKFTGISGNLNYSTVVTDVPTSSKALIFNFITCTDGDGNNYPIVKIGSQVWMGENLKTTKFNDGTTSIPNVTTAWAGLTTPAYCWYNNDEATYKNLYGALYNWYTINTGNLCPTGWHVPTDPEWTTLTTYLGGDRVAGGKIKEVGISHWLSPNIATNESGFTALPSGFHYDGPSFGGIGYFGMLWSATELDASVAWYRSLLYGVSFLDRVDYSKNGGFSVRCIKDYKIVLRILDATSWTLENQTLSIAPNAVIKLYTTKSSFDNNLPDFTTTSDANGMVQLSDLPVQNQYKYILIVEKSDLRNIKDGYIIGGVFNNQADINSWPTQAGAYIGGLKYIDVNGDGIISSDDRTWYDLISLSEDQTFTKTVIIGK